MTTSKTCSGCGEEKPVEDFYLRSDGKGPRPQCKPCYRANGRRYWRRNANEAQRDRCYDGFLRRTYGISLTEYNALAASQGWTCAICGCDPKVANAHMGRHAQRLHVDHCHASGRIRGLLCNRCNVSIAPLERHPDWLQRALSYLERQAPVDARGS